ncbi:MAG TPA: hypothetical protein VL966_17200 [Alphaproteobacteria bacterium]|jgi:hypothetical protein|nr:hypothetical protein [Alphaproteobacteria bacterium]
MAFEHDTDRTSAEISEARRRFLKQCGKFSIATPPAVALLLATAERKYAVAASGGGNNGFGNGGGDGVPGNSNKTDVNR